MRARLVLTTGALAVVAAGVTPALAAGNANTSDTVGNCISDGLFGNEPNLEPYVAGGPAEQEPGSVAGDVVRSASPGPISFNADGSVNHGLTLHEANVLLSEYGYPSVTELCRQDSTSFDN